MSRIYTFYGHSCTRITHIAHVTLTHRQNGVICNRNRTRPKHTHTHKLSHRQAWPGIAMKINFSNFWCVIFMNPIRPCASASRAVAHERVQRTYNAIVWLHVTLSGRHIMCMCVCLSACAYVSTRH